MQIRIEGADLPGSACGPSPDPPGGRRGIVVGVQRRNRPAELMGLVAGDAAAATWVLDCATAPTPSGIDLKGPFLQGPPGGRFIYLSWGTTGASIPGNASAGNDFVMFRRAKLMLDAVPPAVLADAVDRGVLVGRLGLTDCKGGPVCAAVRPPAIDWSAEAAGPEMVRP